MNIVFFVLTGFAVWLLAITILLVVTYKNLSKLTRGVDKGNLINMLEKVLEGQKVNSKSISEIIKEIQEIKTDARLHIQKVGFTRFNPFEELGGDHSFSVALLDGRDSGIIITGLHTRERTRVYVKDIKLGKALIELSEEEKKVLRLAQKIS